MAMADRTGIPTGAALSLMLHGGVALIAAFGLPTLWSKPLPQAGAIAVDLVMQPADSLAVYDPEELTPATPEDAQIEEIETDTALTDEPSEPLETQDVAAAEPERAPEQEQLREALPEETLKPEDIALAEPDPALENAVTLARSVPSKLAESRSAEAVKPVLPDPKVSETIPQPADPTPTPSLDALVAREVLAQAEVSVAEAAPARLEETKSEIVAALEIEPEVQAQPAPADPVAADVVTPLQATEATPALKAVPVPAGPLPRKKPQRIAALAPPVETTPKKKKAPDKPKKKKIKRFSDVASALGRAQPRKRTGTGNIPRLSNAEWDPLRAAIRKCWRLDRGAKEQAEVVVRVRLTKGGYLNGRPILLDSQSPNSPYTRVAFQRAVTALRKCEPYDVLPARKYAGWRQIELVFRPDGVGIQ